MRCSTKCSPISDKVEQNRFCCSIQVLNKKGVLFVFVFCGPAAPGPAPGALGPCARPGLCLAPGASRVPPRSWRGVVLAGGGGSASACRRLAVVAPPARRPPPAPAPRRLAGSLALPSARFGLPCGRPPSAPGAARPLAARAAGGAPPSGPPLRGGFALAPPRRGARRPPGGFPRSAPPGALSPCPLCASLSPANLAASAISAPTADRSWHRWP